jgi:hypothetical protein
LGFALRGFRGFARRRLITAATTIDVLQFRAGQFTHDPSPPKANRNMDGYGLAVSLSVIALQGFAPKGANSIFRATKIGREKVSGPDSGSGRDVIG